MNRPAKSDQDLAKAIQLHQSGDLDRAIRLYEKVVRKQPRHAAALNLLGLACFQAGRAEDAVSPIEKALAIKADLPDARYNLGLILHSLRRFEDAIPHLQQSVAERPADAEARNNLGAALKEAGRYEEAAEQYRAALALNGGYADAHCNLGNALLALGRAAEAMEPFRRALQIRPFFADADVGLGNALTSSDRAKEALAHFERAIALQSGDAEAYLGFGNALAALERHEEAIPQYRKAIELKPDHLDAHLNLGWALRANKHYDEATACFEKALTLPSEHDAEIFTGRGSVFFQLGRYEDSIADFDRAIEINPAFSAAYSKKGNTLLTLGRLEEGRRCFEKAIEIEPRKIGPYHALIHMKGIGGGEARLKALEELAKDMAGFSANERMWLHATLGRVYSDLKQFERAIPHMIEAGRIKRSKLQYDEKDIFAYFDQIQKVFTPELMREKRGMGDPAEVPVFIVGMPRSGTTLIEQILASHPAVFGAGERDDFPALVSHLGEDNSARFPEIVASMNGEALSALGAEYLRRVGTEAKDAARITDKMPGNFHNVGLIHLAMPNAKIVHLIRDPVDNCMSCLSTIFASGHAYSYDLGEVGRYHRAYQALMQHWRRVLPEGAMLEVRYEDVVGDLEVQARRIVAHCGLEWDDACLGFHKTERPVRTASVNQVRQPIYRSSIGLWGAYRQQLLPLFEALEID